MTHNSPGKESFRILKLSLNRVVKEIEIKNRIEDIVRTMSRLRRHALQFLKLLTLQYSQCCAFEEEIHSLNKTMILAIFRLFNSRKATTAPATATAIATAAPAPSFAATAQPPTFHSAPLLTPVLTPVPAAAAAASSTRDRWLRRIHIYYMNVYSHLSTPEDLAVSTVNFSNILDYAANGIIVNMRNIIVVSILCINFKYYLLP